MSQEETQNITEIENQNQDEDLLKDIPEDHPFFHGLTKDQFTTAKGNEAVLQAMLFCPENERKYEDQLIQNSYVNLADNLLSNHGSISSDYWGCWYKNKKVYIHHAAMDIKKPLDKYFVYLNKTKDYPTFCEKLLKQAGRLIVEHKIYPDYSEQTQERVQENKDFKLELEDILSYAKNSGDNEELAQIKNTATELLQENSVKEQ